MKYVFVETNFLINVVRPMVDRTARSLLERGDVTLHVPWCAINEAARTLRQRIINEDLGFTNAMLAFAQVEFLEKNDTASMSAIQKLAEAADQARGRRLASIKSDLDVLTSRMQIIPPSEDVVRSTLDLWKVKSLPPFDEMILGTVLARAEALYRDGERELYFCNLNKNDFSPSKGEEMARVGLKDAYTRCGLTYLTSFELPG